MSRKLFKDEAELASYVVDWLIAQEWDVYQEVSHAGKTCDIVAVRYPVTWCIECKLSFSLNLIEQGYFWRKYANYTSIAIPSSYRDRNMKPLARRVLKDYGIGVLKVNPNGCGWGNVVGKIQPALNRHTIPGLKGSLRAEQKHWAPAGNSQGKRWTPFQGTKLALQNLVLQEKSVLFKTAIENIEHHYRSDSIARRCLKDLIIKGVIDGVMLRKARKLLYVEAEEQK